MKTRVCLLLVLCLAASACWTTSAMAATVQAPQWTVSAMSVPTNFEPAPGSTGQYRVQVQNTGDAPTDGSAITIEDVLPPGLKPAGEASGEDLNTGQSLACSGLKCTYAGVVVADDALVVKVPVEVEAGAPASVTNRVTVSGGGAAEAVRETESAVSSSPANFGLAPGSTSAALSTDQAGAHPDLTVSLGFNVANNDNLVAGNPKETVGELPPGFAGDLADTPRCPAVDFVETQGCPLGSQVGTALVVLGLFGGEPHYVVSPIYNLTTNPGEISRLGFIVTIFGIEGSVSLRPGDYGIKTVFQNIFAGISQLAGVSLTIWGVPADPSHNPMRMRECLGFCTGEGPPQKVGGQSSTSPPVPYLTSPTHCTAEPLTATLRAASWEEPHHLVSTTTGVGPLSGCNLLPFGPAIAASPDTTKADSPAGFGFEVKMGQEGLLSSEGTVASDIENTTATLPAGVAINPGQAAGLGACQMAQAKLEEEGPPACPSNSTVGHVEIETPILRNKLDGNVYLLQSNPPDVKLLVAPQDPADGIFVKFIGDVHLNPATGQLVTTFEHTPQLPFSDLKLSFSGGAQAALTTPPRCGTYTTEAAFAPWSAQQEALDVSSFAIDSGPGGAPCPPAQLPFSPSLDAGATTDQAGGFTGFSMLLSRADGQQRISTLQFKTPKGLLGEISKVPLCPEPQASQGTCSAASQIGHTVVEAGPGPYPLVVPEPGRPPAPIYLTGGYKGAPYGLSIVVPLSVGPFDLGTIVVRAKIEVDPLTAQLTVTTDPLPSIIDGVPADLRTIDAVIDRSQFMFNPTNCAPMSFSGTATSTEGASAPIATHFQVGSCRSLEFKPRFTASTSGKASRKAGASLTVDLSYPKAALGSEANIRYVKVDLPKQLPSYLSTLQKACPAETFSANPAGCPSGSIVGRATASTPVLPVALTGPAYFVSHGGAKWPELVIVLSGYGVTVQLHGETFISKGITSSTFNTIPDVPVASFQLTLPQGENHALAANGNLCAAKLRMPTKFVAQNGLELRQSTPIAATGCAKHKQKRHKHNNKKHQKDHRKK